MLSLYISIRCRSGFNLRFVRKDAKSDILDTLDARVLERIVMKRLIILFGLSILFCSCYMHHSNVQGDGYGVKTIFRSSDKKLEVLPIRLEFRPQTYVEAVKQLREKGTGVNVKADDIAGYSSQEIISQFRRSSKFVVDPNANIKIRIRSTVDEVKSPVVTMIAGILTFGFVPFIYRTYGTIYFEIVDTEKEEVLKIYKYPVEHRSFMGWYPILLAPILSLFNDKIDHSTSPKTFTIMRAAYSQFEYDFINEVSSVTNLASRFFRTRNHNYALLFLDQRVNDSQNWNNLLYTSLQSGFLENGLSLVERKRLDKVISEIQLSNSGITENTRLKLGKLLEADRLIFVEDFSAKLLGKGKPADIFFSVRCTDVLTGKIIWAEKIESSISDRYLDNDTNISEGMFKIATEALIEKLRQSGEF
ncbi:hypothetical protein V6Z05_11475 [Leptospira venezuelensis]|uniref:hypothetical protein n=1 Tax=Leptospira venezuelensis TaxID=1958811 RepID=UPI000A36F1D0|nr:hypothetical protein [Leptospira venezuelensis]